MPPNSSGTGPLILADLSVSPEVALEGLEAAARRLADAGDGDRLVLQERLVCLQFRPRHDAGPNSLAALPPFPVQFPFILGQNSRYLKH